MPSNRPLKILILGLNYAPEQVGVAVYTTGLAEAMIRRGHQVEVVAGKPYYPSWTVPPEFRSGWKCKTVEGGVNVTRVAHYVPAKPTGIRRLLHHVSFALSCFFPTLAAARSFKPDIVVTVAPSLITAPVASIAARVSNARSWLHVQDFEVEAAMATGLVRERGFGARMALWFERSTIGLFDRASSISPAMCRKLIEKGVSPTNVTEFRNWVDVNTVRPLEALSPYRKEWNIATPHVALYSGNIGNKQGIEIIVAAARNMQHRSDLTFVICGDGPYVGNLRKLAEGLGNIQFRSLQPKERLNELLGLATIHLLPQRSGAADLVLPSKLTGMLASGRAIVATATSGTGLADEVEDCGIVVPPENETAFANAIEHLLDADAERSAYGTSARHRAEQRWDRDAIISRFEDALLTCCDRSVSAEIPFQKALAE